MPFKIDEGGTSLKALRKPVKFDDRPGHVSDQGKRYGVSEHIPGEANKRFCEYVLTGKSDMPAYYVDRDGAQRMANGLRFYVQKTTLGKARDNNLWVVGVGNDASGSFSVSLMEKCYQDGEEVPRRRWPHNAVRYHDLRGN